MYSKHVRYVTHMACLVTGNITLSLEGSCKDAVTIQIRDVNRGHIFKDLKYQQLRNHSELMVTEYYLC